MNRLFACSREGGLAPTSELKSWQVSRVSDAFVSVQPGIPKAFCSARTEGLWVGLFGQPRLDGVARSELATTFLQHYRTEGAACAKRLRGHYAWVLIDGQGDTARVLCAVDRFATIALTYAEVNGQFAVATDARLLTALQGFDPNPDRQALYDYFYFHMIPGPKTVYAQARRVLPGELVAWTGRSIEASQIYSPHFVEPVRADFEEQKTRFRDALLQGVKETAEGASVGAFLSGGTDSSTVSGLLGQVTGAPARTYSIGFDEPGYDEMAFARISAKHFGTRHKEYYVTPQNIVDALPLIAQSYDQPFGNASAIPTYYCAKLAREDGCERILGGDGGDELYGGNERYATQAMLSRWGELPALVRKPVELASRVLPNLSINRKARNFIALCNTPLPARLQNYNLLDRIGADHLFTSNFLNGIDRAAPIAHLNGIYHPADAASQLNKLLALDFRITLADSDLPKVTNMCHLAGIDIGYPMLADAVLDHSLQLPVDFKLRGKALRWFFKESLNDFLPNEVITKSKHGFGLPFGPWINKYPPLGDLVGDTLSDFKRRDIVRPAFVDQLMNEHLKAHAGYYGVMVWLMLMLEWWLRRPADAPA